MTDVSVNLPASMRSTSMLLRTATAVENLSLKRLTSGLKINSAIEGPQQFFASRSLARRADDLMVLKEGMGQAIATIKAASSGVTSVKGLMDQARSLTSEALATLDNAPFAIEMRRELANNFNLLIKQIDRVVADSAYGGKNLLLAMPPRYQATDDSLATATEITGVDAVEVSNVYGQDSFRIDVTGEGTISGNAADIVTAQQELGLAQLSISGLNSLDQGSFEDIRFELHGKPGRDARMVVLDGNETWTTSFSQTSLKALASSGQQQSITHTFSSGARINMVIDGKAMLAALEPSGLVKANVGRDLDLEVNVTDNLGVTLFRSADTQDSGNRLQHGENSFRFGNGTVRLTIDQKAIQGASRSEGGVFGDLGAFTGVIAPGGPTTIDMPDTLVRLEVQRSGFGASGVTFNQYSKLIGGGEIWSQLDPFAGATTMGGGAGQSGASLSFNPVGLSGSTSNGVFMFNRDPGTGGLTTVADGDFDNNEFSNPFVSGWKQSAQLSVTYGATSGGSRTVTVTDGLGGSFTGTVRDNGDGQPASIRLSGGVNDGATLGLFHNSGAAGSRTIDMLVGLDSYAVASDATSRAAAGFDDLAGWSGFGVDSAVDIAVGAANSGGLGLRTVSITDTAIDGGSAGTSNYTIGNGAAGDLTFALTSGPNTGATVQFDVGGAAASFSYRVAAMNTQTSRPAEFSIRSAALGEGASINTVQTGVASAENDLTVSLNERGSNRLHVAAVNLGTGPLGLGVDLASNQWRDRTDIALAIKDLGTADIRLQSALRGLETNVDILNTRSDFTDEFASTLRNGADRLVAADRQAESAQALTASVRRQLATTMLSLMVQSQQRLLQLF